MPIIALVGNKGGAGKTTLSLNLATFLARQSSAVLVDADPQGSTLQWRAFSENKKTVAVYEADDELEGQVNGLMQEYNYVVVDCPPSVHAPQTTAVLELTDIALIPVQPSPVDLWATVYIEEAVEKARNKNTMLKAFLVINQMESRTTLSKLVREALLEIGLPVTNTALRRRAIYRNSVLEGKSVFDMGRRGRDAVHELEQLVREILPDE